MTDYLGSFSPLNVLFDKAQVKKTAANLRPDEEEMGLCRLLLDAYNSGLRNLIDGVVGLKAAERKEYIKPWADLGKRLTQKMRPNSSRHVGPLKAKLQACAKNYGVFLGWLKNRYRYRDGELQPPASTEDLVALREELRRLSDNSGFNIPSALCDSMLICAGMAPNVRTNPMGGFTIFKLEDIPGAYQNMVEKYEFSQYMIPFSEDGAGNLYAISSDNDVFLYNHEDGSQNRVSPLAKMIAKAHKVTR